MLDSVTSKVRVCDLAADSCSCQEPGLRFGSCRTPALPSWNLCAALKLLVTRGQEPCEPLLKGHVSTSDHVLLENCFQAFPPELPLVWFVPAQQAVV